MLQMTLRRALSPLLPNLDAQLVPYSRSRAGQSASRPVSSVHHPPATTTNPPAQEGEHLLDKVAHPGYPHQQDEGLVLPRNLPLASKFSLSSVEDERLLMQQTEGVEEQMAAGGEALPSHQQLPSQTPLAARGVGPTPDQFGVGTSHVAPGQTQASIAAMAPHQPLQEQVVAQHSNNRIPSNRQQLIQHQRLEDDHLGSGAVNVKPGRVSVDTAGTVRRTVITMAELQSTVQPELPAFSPQRAYHDDHVAVGLAWPASEPASQHQEDSAAGSQTFPARQSHAVMSQALSTQQRMSAAGASPEAELPQPAASQSQDRALQNSPALNSAHHRANSPPHEGKALFKHPTAQLMAIRQSDDADAVLQSQQAVSESGLLSAVQDLHHAQDDKAAAAAVQALQLHISHASTAAVQACLPQVRVCVCASALSIPYMLLQDTSDDTNPLCKCLIMASRAPCFSLGYTTLLPLHTSPSSFTAQTACLSATLHLPA